MLLSAQGYHHANSSALWLVAVRSVAREGSRGANAGVGSEADLTPFSRKTSRNPGEYRLLVMVSGHDTETLAACS